jgi:hypothetical protein
VKENLQVVVVFVFLAFMFIMTTSCNKTDETPMNGQVRILLTDAPYPIALVENAYVTLEKIELRKKDLSDGSADDNNNANDDSGDSMDHSDGDGSPYIVVMDEPKEFNLMDLQNGVTEELALVEIPAGNYDLVRMYMQGGTIELKDGGTHDFKIPSGASSGLKVFIWPGLEVQGGITEELLLDINLNKSLVMKGNPDNIQGFNFKPVVRAMNVSTTGRVEGIVTDASQVALEGADVWVENDAEEEIVTAISDGNGFYALPGVPAGTFTLLAAKENYDTVKVDNVIVKQANRTEVNIELTESAEASE